MVDATRPIKIVYAYASEDQSFVNALDGYLERLKQLKQVETWKEKDIIPGQIREQEITDHLNAADIILLMVSVDYQKSEYASEKRTHLIEQRLTQGTVRVIPVILRPTPFWEDEPFAKRESLPTGKSVKPVNDWKNHDAAYTNIATGIRKAVDQLRKKLAAQANQPDENKKPEEDTQGGQQFGTPKPPVHVEAAHLAPPVEPEPTDAAGYIKKGDVLRDSGKLDEAKEAYEQAIRLQFENVEAHVRLGHTLIALDKLLEAMKQFHDALFLDSMYYPAHQGKGHVLYKQKKYQEALKCYDEAIELAKGTRPAHEIASILLRKAQVLRVLGRDEEALAIEKEAGEQAPAISLFASLSGSEKKIGEQPSSILAVDSPSATVVVENKTGDSAVQISQTHDGPGIDVQLLSKTFPTAYWHAMTKDSFPLVTVSIDNTCSHCVNARFTVEAIIQGFSELAIETTRTIPAGSVKQIHLLPRLSNENMISLTEIRTASCRIRVKQHGKGGPVEIYDNTYDLQLQPMNTALIAVIKDHRLEKDLANYLAVFVTPNDPKIQEFMGKVAAERPDKALIGYQASGGMTIQQKCMQSREQAKAIFVALKKHVKPLYVFSAKSFGSSPDTLAQRVRLPAQCLPRGDEQVGQAYCLDGALLFASLLENIQMEPLIVLIPGHAFVGWHVWRGSDTFDFLETTMIRDYSFEKALDEGNRQYREAIASGDDKRLFLDTNGFMRIVDIAASRKEAIFPLS